ncbi:hypothetical protein LUZ60_002681 [Juncus effusus]|nr:hypothetical protein LUZ60_002681 [Juncus effusus]
MANKRQKSAKKDLVNESETNNSENSNRQFNLGDLTWVKIRDSAWWPAQVVDEETVSDKPKRKSKDEILCRLYGTYEYVYVDAWKSKSEFEDVLKRENKSIKEKFYEVVNEDISLMKLKVKSKSKASKSKDTAKASKGKMKQSDLTPKSTQSVSAIKKKQDSIIGKRKLNFCEEKREETNPDSESSKKKCLISTKKQKITNQEGSSFSPCKFSKVESEKLSSKEKTLITDKKQKNPKNINQESSRGSPRNLPKEKSEKLSSPKTKINKINSSKEKKNSALNSGNEEEMKAKDMEIRKIVRDILFGGINTPKKDQNPKTDSNAKLKSIKAKEKVEKKNGKKKDDLKDANLKKKNETKNPKHLEISTPLSVPEEKGSLSERKIRVMQSLGLIAPFGSPFGKNGLVQ